MYEPQPIDASRVTLGQPLSELSELLARNAHELWAQRRLADGWTFGPTRDDARKQHPCLVPYEQLPESEKDYDRKLSLGTLAAITALGYRIEPPTMPGAEEPQSATAGALRADLARLESTAGLDLPVLLGIWQGRQVEEWAREPAAYRLLASRMLGVGQPLLAYDVAGEGLQHWPGDVRLRQLEALALARSGATERANQLLRDLYAKGHADEETLGMLGRTYKDLGLAAAEPSERQSHLARARELYAEAFDRYGGYWSGINAATLAVLEGERERAAALARAVRAQCQRLADGAGGGEDYWALATLGEAALVLGDRAEAVRWYARAAAAGRQRLGDLASTRRNARLLLDHLPGDREAIDRALRMPAVAVFAGDGADGSGSPQTGAPASEGAARDALCDRLAQRDCRVGYASAAPGGDLLFLEALLALGGEIHVVLPYDQEPFLRDGAASIGDPAWAERAEQLLRRAARVIVASPQRAPSGPATYEFASLLLRGLATSHAQHLETDLVPLALWGGPDDPGPGGASDTVREWQARGLAVEVVRSATAPGDTPALRSATAPPAVAPGPYPTEVIAMLFGDAVHFSHLDEEQVVIFGQRFLGAIGELVAAHPHAPIFTNTWGDGLYFVFGSVRDAGLFALALRDVVNDTDWTAYGLPRELNLRIGLHAGPVHRTLDPITRRVNYLGTHVSRAARIEPITPPGRVYTSEPFAALAAADGIREFVCDYVGQTPLAKGFGTFPTYHLRAT